MFNASESFQRIRTKQTDESTLIMSFAIAMIEEQYARGASNGAWRHRHEVHEGHISRVHPAPIFIYAALKPL